MPDFEPATTANDLHTKRRKVQFNVDVARSILLMCSIVYERDVGFVQKAASGAISRPSLGDSDNLSEPNEGILYLLKSEEYMYRQAHLWKLRFVSMAGQSPDLSSTYHSFVLFLFECSHHPGTDA
jgi:hypothetical protein